MVVISDNKLGFNSEKGACETTTTSKTGSRCANYQILTQEGIDKNNSTRLIKCSCNIPKKYYLF